MQTNSTSSLESRPPNPGKASLAKVGVRGLLVVLLMASGLFILLKLGERISHPATLSSESLKPAATFEHRYTIDPIPAYVVWSPDSRRFAAVSGDGPMRFWDIEADHFVSSTEVLTNVSSLKWSPDGSVLAAANFSNTIKLVDVPARQVMKTFSVPVPDIMPTVSKRTGLPLIYLSFEVHLLGWSTNGRNLVSFTQVGASDSHGADNRGADGVNYSTIQVWEAGTGKLLRYLVISDGQSSIAAQHVKLAPDGHTSAAIAYSYDQSSRKDSGVLKLWDLDTGTLKHTYQMAEYDPYTSIDIPDPPALTWSPDSHMLALWDHYIVQLIDPATGKVEQSLPEILPPTYTPSPPPTYVPIPTPQPTMLKLGEKDPHPVPTKLGDKIPTPIPTYLPPDYTPPPTHTPLPTPTADKELYSPVISVAWSPDGSTLATYDFDAIRLWDVQTGKVQKIMRHVDLHRYPHAKLAWSTDGNFLLSIEPDAETLWDPATGRELGRMDKARPIKHVEWSPDGHYIVIFAGQGADDGVYAAELWGVEADAHLMSTPIGGNK